MWDYVLGRIKNNTPRIHICGGIRQIAPVLMSLRFPTGRQVLFCHDFTGSYRENIGQLTSNWVNRTNAIIGAGVVSSGSHIVEIPLNVNLAEFREGFPEMVVDPPDAIQLYRELIQAYEKDKLMLYPSCGFGSLMKTLGLDSKNAIHQYIAMNYVIGPKLAILRSLTDGSYN